MRNFFCRNKSYKMSNKTKTMMVATEMVPKTKPGNRDNEDHVDKRILGPS